MLKFYSPKNYCGVCEGFKMMMNRKGIKYEIINDDDLIHEIVEKNDLKSIPFAEIDGNILNTMALNNWIKEQ